MDLKQARRIIDEADTQIAEALTKRFLAVTSVGAYKFRSGLPAVDPTRRQAVIDAAEQAALALGGDPELAKRIYELMTDYCADIQDQYMKDGTGPLADHIDRGLSQEPDGTLIYTRINEVGHKVSDEFKAAAQGIEYKHWVLDVSDEEQGPKVVKMSSRSFEKPLRMPRDIRAIYKQLQAKFS